MISIIVPVYNAEKYLSECIDSILAQNISNIEVILINDGSNDNSGKICDIYSKQDQRVIVIHSKNRGRVSARRTGIEKARGKYIMFVDADDWIDNNICETLVEKIEKYNSDFVISGYIREDGTKEAVMNVFDEGFYKTKSDLDILRLNALVFEKKDIFGMVPTIWAKLYKRTLALEIIAQIPDSLYRGEDMTFTYLYLLRCTSAYVISSCLYHYRSHNMQTVQSPSPDFISQIGIAHNILINAAKNALCSKQCIQNINKRTYLNFIRLWNYNYNNDRIFYYYLKLNDLVSKKIVLYGAGKVGTDIYNQLNHFLTGSVVLWVDKYSHEKKYNVEVSYIEKIKDISFDIIVIAVENTNIANEIKSELIEQFHIPPEKIYWKKPLCYWVDANECSEENICKG